MEPARAFERKVDRFFETHVLTSFDPERIEWWFSLSGGKDSFAMAKGVQRWYRRRNLRLTARGFTIDQWGGAASRSIAAQLDGVEIHVVDGRSLTREVTAYEPGQQAPCRPCADVRRHLGDRLLDAHRPAAGSVAFLARGLHLSDTAISLAWRHALGRDAATEMIEQGKAHPLVSIGTDVYLVKPLAYVREYESEVYAAEAGYLAACCGCPACQFPSRRDIVEESIAHFYSGPLWEFDVPGLTAWLTHHGAPDLASDSSRGRQSKHAHLPPGFGAFAVEQFRVRLARHPAGWDTLCDADLDLDRIGAKRLAGDALVNVPQVPMPAILTGRPLDAHEEMMIATMGPFWGAIGLVPAIADIAWALQRTLLDFCCDERWGQVNSLIREFYGRPRRVVRSLPVVASRACGGPQS